MICLILIKRNRFGFLEGASFVIVKESVRAVIFPAYDVFRGRQTQLIPSFDVLPRLMGVRKLTYFPRMMPLRGLMNFLYFSRLMIFPRVNRRFLM